MSQFNQLKPRQKGAYYQPTFRRHSTYRPVGADAQRNRPRFGRVVVVALFSLICVYGLVQAGHIIGANWVKNGTAHASTDDEIRRLQTAVAPLTHSQPEVTVGIAYLDLTTGAQAVIGSSASFEGASTTKLITAAAFLKLVEEGRASLDEPMSAYTAGFELREMVQQSDNDAWDLLTSAVGYPQLEQYAHSIGMSSYKVDGNTLTAADEALLLKKLYDGQLLNKHDTALLLSYMQHTNNEDMIPTALGDQASVYHKYGELDGELHDAAIVRSSNHSFVLVVYTKGANDNDYQNRAALIRQIARAMLSEIEKS